MTDRDLCFVPAATLLRLYRTRKVSPLEVMRAVLARIDAVNPRVNAYVTVAREAALAAAKKATAALGRKGAALGPLHGIPVSIKHLTPTKGIRTTWGSKVFEHHVPDEDALYVARLKDAGAIVVGKTNTPEFGAGGNTFNAVFGATRNPWNPALTCGGSSGGAAVALATGMEPLAQGSDLGGSLRTPAAFCGVVGFRTTPGLIPVYPADIGWDSLSVTGPMARTVGDVALMLSAMAGPDDRAPLSYDVDPRRFPAAVKQPSVKGWRAAWTRDLNGLIPVDDEVAAVAERATRVFRSSGCGRGGAPDFGEVNEIVLASRGLSMVARHPTKLAQWSRHAEGPDLEHQAGRARSPRADRPRRVQRTNLWHGCASSWPPATCSAPTVAVPLFRSSSPIPPRSTASRSTTTRSVLPDLRHHRDRAARDLGPLRLHRSGYRWDCRSSPPASGGRVVLGRAPRGRPPWPPRSRRWWPAGDRGDRSLDADAHREQVHDEGQLAVGRERLGELRLLVALLFTVRVPRLGDQLPVAHVDLGALAPVLVAQGQRAVVGPRLADRAGLPALVPRPDGAARGPVHEVQLEPAVPVRIGAHHGPVPDRPPRVGPLAPLELPGRTLAAAEPRAVGARDGLRGGRPGQREQQASDTARTTRRATGLRSARQSAQRSPGEAGEDPLSPELGPQAPVEANRGTVPV